MNRFELDSKSFALQPSTRQRRTNEWACVSSFAGPRCIRSRVTSHEESKRAGFETEKDCLESDCFRYGQKLMHSSNIVDMLGHYLDTASVQALAQLDPYTNTDLSNSLAISRRARELRKDLETRLRKHWIYVNDLLSIANGVDGTDKNFEVLAAKRAIAELIDSPQDEIPNLAGSFLINEGAILKNIKRLFPQRYPRLVWSLLGNNALYADKLVQEVDMTVDDDAWPETMENVGIFRLLRTWTELKSHSPAQVNAVVSKMPEFLERFKNDDGALSLEFAWPELDLLSILADIGILALYLSDDEHMDIMTSIINESLSNLYGLNDRLVTAISALEPPLSLAQDKLLASLISSVAGSRADIESAMRNARLTSSSPMSMSAISHLDDDGDEKWLIM